MSAVEIHRRRVETFCSSRWRKHLDEAWLLSAKS
jgi:hypothetical protein